MLHDKTRDSNKNSNYSSNKSRLKKQVARSAVKKPFVILRPVLCAWKTRILEGPTCGLDGKTVCTRTFVSPLRRVRWRTSGPLRNCTRRVRRARSPIAGTPPPARPSVDCYTARPSPRPRCRPGPPCTAGRTRRSPSGRLSETPVCGRSVNDEYSVSLSGIGLKRPKQTRSTQTWNENGQRTITNESSCTARST